MTDIEERLRDYGQRWRAHQSSPRPIDDAPWQSGSKKRFHEWSALRPPIAVLAAACLLIIGVAGALLYSVTRPDARRVVAGGDVRGSSAETGRPLLARLPPPSDLVLVTSGQVGGLIWEFYAKSSRLGAEGAYQSLDPPLAMQGGLCTAIRFKRDASSMEGVVGGSGPCGDPREMPVITLAGIGPGTGLSARMLMGITSVPASRVQIAYGEGTPSIDVQTVTNPAFPDLWFFVADVPAGRATQLVAVAADGTPLMHADPAVLPRFP